MLGVPVRLHFTFILLFIFLLVTDLGSHEASASYALFLLGIFVSVLLHEMAHAFVATRFGVRTTEIVMFPIGGLSRMERVLKPTEELWITLAGLAVNVLVSAAIFAYMFLRSPGCAGSGWWICSAADGRQRAGASRLRQSDAGGALNLLPAFPMDGGRLR